MRNILGDEYYNYASAYERGIMWNYIQERERFKNDISSYKDTQKSFQLDYCNEVFLFCKNHYPDVIVRYMTDYMTD